MDGVIDNQKYMFSYHSGLNSTHPYQSAWYEWPLGNRPVWFYCLHGIVHAALDADFPLRVRISLLCDRADDNTCLCICAQAL